MQGPADMVENGARYGKRRYSDVGYPPSIVAGRADTVLHDPLDCLLPAPPGLLSA